MNTFEVRLDEWGTTVLVGIKRTPLWTRLKRTLCAVRRHKWRLFETTTTYLLIRCSKCNDVAAVGAKK